MDPQPELSTDARLTEVNQTQAELLDSHRVVQVLEAIQAIRQANKTNADILKSHHEAMRQGIDAGGGVKGNELMSDELVKLLELLPGITLTDNQKAEIKQSIYTDGDHYMANLWEDRHPGQANLDNSWSSVELKRVFSQGNYSTGVIIDAVHDLEGRSITLAFDEPNIQLRYVTVETSKHSGYPYQKSSVTRAMVRVDKSGKILEKTGKADAIGSVNLEQELKALTNPRNLAESLPSRD